MRTYTFIVDDMITVHVDLNNIYGYSEARSLMTKFYPDNHIKFIPIVMLNRTRNNYIEERTLFAPYGQVCAVRNIKWREYVNMAI